MPINNFEIIRKLLHFELDGDVYFAEVIARGKDKGLSGEHLIRDFHIHSLEHFDKLMPEIIDLCDHYGARCYLRLNQRNMDELNSYLKIKLEEQEIIRKQALRKFLKNGCDKNRIEKLPKVVSASKLFASVMGHTVANCEKLASGRLTLTWMIADALLKKLLLFTKKRFSHVAEKFMREFHPARECIW